MRCWEQVRKRLTSLGEGLGEKIIHHDPGSVYASYRWREEILLEDNMRVSYSESGAKGNPWIESLWGRMKASGRSLGSRKPRPCQHCEPSLTSGSSATTRTDDTPRSGRFHPENISGRLSLPANQNLNAAASQPQLAGQLVQKFGHTSERDPSSRSACFRQPKVIVWVGSNSSASPSGARPFQASSAILSLRLPVGTADMFGAQMTPIDLESEKRLSCRVCSMFSLLPFLLGLARKKCATRTPTGYTYRTSRSENDQPRGL